jgi:hypothetical protein
VVTKVVDAVALGRYIVLTAAAAEDLAPFMAGRELRCGDGGRWEAWPLVSNETGKAPLFSDVGLFKFVATNAARMSTIGAAARAATTLGAAGRAATTLGAALRESHMARLGRTVYRVTGRRHARTTRSSRVVVRSRSSRSRSQARRGTRSSKSPGSSAGEPPPGRPRVGRSEVAAAGGAR